MSYKILTKNGIDNSNIDGARGEYFNSGMRDGIVQGALNEGLFTATASNIISLDTCELRIAGHRIVIDEPVYHAFSNAPSTDTRYAFVAQIVVDENQNVDFSLFVQTASTPLIQNDLYKNITGVGTYQVEIGRFTLLTSLTIEDVVRTIDVITGGGDKGEQGEQGADGKDALTTSYVFSETTDPNPQDIMLIDDDEFNRTPENDEDLIVLWNNTTTGDTFICNCKTIVGISASGTNVKILNYYKLNASGGGGGSGGNNPIASFSYLTNITDVYYNESFGIDFTGEGFYSDNLGGHTINSAGMTLPIIAGEGISITTGENNNQIIISSTGGGGSGGTVIAKTYSNWDDLVADFKNFVSPGQYEVVKMSINSYGNTNTIPLQGTSINLISKDIQIINKDLNLFSSGPSSFLGGFTMSGIIQFSGSNAILSGIYDNYLCNDYIFIDYDSSTPTLQLKREATVITNDGAMNNLYGNTTFNLSDITISTISVLYAKTN